MVIELLMIGKIREPYVVNGCDHFHERLRHYCRLTVTELAIKEQGLSPEDQKSAENRLIFSKLKPRHALVVLDERGQSVSSPGLAGQLEKWGNAGIDRVQFVVRKADWIWSLSSLTFPHPLVRLILMEQLYRAFSILHHQPYHHG
jgi:23S rRNA (pseudouridine1915-N3)-methyltransferase